MVGRSIRPALSVIDAKNHAGYLWITTILGVVYTSFVAVARVYVKLGVLGTDDYILGFATIFHLAQAVPIFIGLANGLGKSTSLTGSEESARIGETFLASEALAVITLSLVKCSVLAVVIRGLTLRYERRWYICWVLVAANVLWGLGSVLGLLVSCNGATLLSAGDAGHCSHQLLRWDIITGIDIATELIICSLPLAFTWNLNMRSKLKFEVVLAFSFRLPMIALSVLHLQSLNGLAQSKEPQLAVTTNLLYLQVMLAWSLVSATIPNMRSFMKSFDTRFGMPAATEAQRLTNEFPLVTIGGTLSTKGPTRKRVSRSTQMTPERYSGDDEQASRPTFRPDTARDIATITHADAESETMVESGHYIGGNGSQEMIIKKEVP